MEKYDVIIVGAGIVGLATAYQLLKKNPKIKLALIEKENKIAQHQTGNNSGVIHSGIYYKPRSLRALNCIKGYNQLIEFCKKNDVEFELCGKVIVATQKSELNILENIYNTGIANGLVGLKKVTPEEINTIESHVTSIKGIYVPQAGIINFKDVAAKYCELIERMGGKLYCSHKVEKIETKNSKVTISSSRQEFSANIMVNCAGLYSDKIAKMTMPELDIIILPFRGEYYKLIKEKEYLVNNLIYPVPNPAFPFLGVHFTRMMEGGIEAGPNAVLAFRREGYKKSDFHLGELFETLTSKGFRKIAGKYWKEGLDEMRRSFSKKAFVKTLQKLIPEIREEDLITGGAGVRAMACDSKGNLLDDFVIFENDKIINVCNAPSPAATASLAIGKTIVEKILKRF